MCCQLLMTQTCGPVISHDYKDKHKHVAPVVIVIVIIIRTMLNLKRGIYGMRVIVHKCIYSSKSCMLPPSVLFTAYRSFDSFQVAFAFPSLLDPILRIGSAESTH